MPFLRILCRIFFKLFVPTTVFYPENVPTSGPVVLVSNHETILDMFMIGYRLPRYLKWMAKEELFRFKPFAKLITYWGAYPLKRGSRDVGAARTTELFLQQGEIVGIFPQGTRSKGRGRALPVKPGFVRFALETGALIQPTAIWPKNKKGKIGLFRRTYVRFGEPFQPSELLGDAPDRAAVQALADRTMQDIYDMMEVPLADRQDRKG